MNEPLDRSSGNHAQRLLARLDAIAGSLQQRRDALALLALGSVGRERARVDACSDLDFFVLVRPGAKQRYLHDLSWLEAAHPLSWSFRNTVDGHKAWMTDGVFCEFAVFELAELPNIPYASGRFVWRREEVDAALADPQLQLPKVADDEWLVGEALSNLYVGLNRYARGERLAAMRLVQVHALDRLLELLDKQHGPGEVSRDPFSVDRRIEVRMPEMSARLQSFAPGYADTPQAALAILAELEQHASVPESVSSRIRRMAATPDQADAPERARKASASPSGTGRLNKKP